MKTIIRNKNVDISDALKLHLDEKARKLEKYLHNHDSLELTALFVIEGLIKKVEITIPTKNFTLRIEEKHDDLYTAIDHAIDKLERQIRKQKGKFAAKINEDSIKNVDFIFEDVENLPQEDFYVKEKKIFAKPMDISEAIMQMELLNHDFYVYKDIDTNNISVVYHRHSGGYGVIENS